MGGQYDTKGVEEVMTVVKVAVLAVLTAVKKDGWQPSDLGAFLKSPDFETALVPALKDAVEIPLELAELDFFDDLHLARAGYNMMGEVVAALKKPAA